MTAGWKIYKDLVEKALAKQYSIVTSLAEWMADVASNLRLSQ